MDSRYHHLKYCRHLLSSTPLSPVKKLRLETHLVRVAWLLLAIEEDKVGCRAVDEEVFRELSCKMVELRHTYHNDYIYDKLISDLNELVAILSETEAGVRNRGESAMSSPAPVSSVVTKVSGEKGRGLVER